ncbi:pyridoxal phosphate-dependent decarboxylase family protein [Gaiella sp.]|jgi:glutamate/tyrosine decarboxylase-like PLP-dependent enzyme|uniref:pyridoxal phosphate-dependent decarboxylase family protein n=1 Tax=Gaiella sp. TaxID=2663207 RepID=UPI002E2EB4A5|nr:pyridoxal-dependent decarboxylase [Gaiella sp.]HEX5582574.1 pyridoxal-dependent decarboxylase [Gaiella sp.]
MTERELLRRAAELAADHLDTLDTRPVYPQVTVDELRARIDVPLPDGPSDPADVVEELAAALEPGVVASQSGRYFGFVVGSSLPAALAADVLVSTWDQNLGLLALGPSALVAENTAGAWAKDLLGVPADASFAFVTGCQTAHFTCLAAARQHVLAAAGWDVAELGLAGSPPISVLVGAKRHSTIDRALRFLGIGRAQIRVLEALPDGRLDPAALADALAEDAGPTIVCAQAGEVNTGVFDDLEAVADAVEGTGAWLHVDGAFGLWAAAAPSLGHLLAGSERADSWATDAHKWLNVPYDCGIAFCAHPDPHREAMTAHAEYYVRDPDAIREPIDWTPEHSRRARAVPVYAALRQLGRSGVADLVERSCARARQFAAGIAELPGCEVLNDVVLNQVLFRFGDDDATSRTLAAVQASGEAWMSGTEWDGRPAIRLSVSSWRTTEQDVDRTVAAFRAWL